jgi:hypothetical protein
MPQATVKTYDSITRSGVLVADDGATEWSIDPEAMEAGMFRFLRPVRRRPENHQPAHRDRLKAVL